MAYIHNIPVSIITIRYTSGFVFGSLLEQDLDAFVTEWNTHPIRPNVNTDSPHGRPDNIYDMPTLHGKLED